MGYVDGDTGVCDLWFIRILRLYGRVCRCVGVSVCRCVGVSVCRCVGVSVCRCVGVSVCRCVGVSGLRLFTPNSPNLG